MTKVNTGQRTKKIIKKQKGEDLGALLIPLARAALSIFSSRKNKQKTWQEETQLSL